MPESTQHKLDRIRPPRVQITYDVETRGSFVKMELPFVAGILADLSGDAADPKPLRERKYVEIDRDNFNEIMKSIGPKVALNGDGKTLSFESLDDFSPIKVLEKLELNARYEKRKHLSDIVAKLDGNIKLQEKLIGVLKDQNSLKALKVRVDDIKATVNEKQGEQGQVESTEKPKDSEGGKKE